MSEYNDYKKRISSKIVPIEEIDVENNDMIVPKEDEEASTVRLETYASLASKGLVHPHSSSKMVWDLFLAALILFSVVIVPYRIAFAVDVDGAMLILDYMIDMFFGMDIVLSFRQVVYVPEKGLWSTDSWENSKMYVPYSRFSQSYITPVSYTHLTLPTKLAV